MSPKVEVALSRYHKQLESQLVSLVRSLRAMQCPRRSKTSNWFLKLFAPLGNAGENALLVLLSAERTLLLAARI